MAPAPVVVLAHGHDAGARRLVRHLAARAAAPFVLRPEQLATARWSHRVDGGGTARTTLTLATGAVLGPGDVGCLLNRIDALPVRRFERSTPRDRDYAAMELQALVASWLAGLGDRVVNPVTARATDAGPTSNRLWLARAAARGLPVARSLVATSARLVTAAGAPGDPPLRPLGPWVPKSGRASTGRVPVEAAWSEDDGGDHVVVAGDRTTGPLAPRFGAACAAVASESGCRLVGFRFAGDGRGEDGWALRRVTTRPALDRDEALAAAADLMASIAAFGEAGR